MAGAYWYDKPVGHRLARITNWLTGLVGVTLIVLCLSSWLGSGPFVQDAPWLHLKVALYGAINLMVIWMIVAFDPDRRGLRAAGRRGLQAGDRGHHQRHDGPVDRHHLVHLRADRHRRVHRHDQAARLGRLAAVQTPASQRSERVGEL